MSPRLSRCALGSIVPALSRSTAARALLAAFSLCCLHAALAAESPAPIPWAYSAYFGTGVYQVNDAETSYVIRAAPSWRIREASLDEQGHRRSAGESACRSLSACTTSIPVR